jgi:hypothetical protein
MQHSRVAFEADATDRLLQFLTIDPYYSFRIGIQA